MKLIINHYYIISDLINNYNYKLAMLPGLHVPSRISI
jgi:hypothetical protein